MAAGYVHSAGVPVEMKRNNTQYWDEASSQWKAPNTASYYDGTKWIPFIRSIPEPGARISGGADGGRVYYESLPPGQSSTFYINPLSILTNNEYDAGATVDSGIPVEIWFQRAADSTTTRNVGFFISLILPDGHGIANSGRAVYAGESFSIRTSANRLTDGMYLRWYGNEGGNFNTGWQFAMNAGCSLQF